MTIFQKLFVTSYRYLAIILLGGVLSTAGGYLGLIGFYTLNSSWAAPIIISHTNEHIMSLTAEMFTARQNLEALETMAQSDVKESAAMRDQVAVLSALVERSRDALTQQASSDRLLAANLSPLRAAKLKNDAAAVRAAQESKAMLADVDVELRAGLITKDDAARSRAELLSAQRTATSELISTVALTHQMADLGRSVATMSSGASGSPQALELVSRAASMEAQIVDLRLKAAHDDKDAVDKNGEAASLRKIIATLADSPYYRASASPIPLSYAFVPYENEDHAKVGTPVYDCLAHVLFCSQVGTVKSVHRDEEKGRHPLFKQDIRGFLVELDLKDASAAKSRVLFFGSKPLGV